VEAVGAVPVTVRKGDEASLSSDLAALLDQPLPEDGGPLASLVSLSFGTDRSAVALLIHHALMDGRGAGAVLQQVLRMVETGERANPSCAAVPPPSPLRDRLASEPRTARTARDVVSAVRAERAGLPSPDRYPFHARHVPTRRTRVHAILVEPVSRLVSAAREANATVHGLVAAAALQSAAALDGEGSKRALTLAVATPTDLRGQVEHPLADDDVMLATGLLCTPYTVAGDAPDLAGHISEQTHREFARGESQLFYRLARAGSFAATEAGRDQLASWLDAAPANIAISNPRIVSAAGDPAWVRSLSLTLSPSANQLAFVALATYRDRLTARDHHRRREAPATGGRRVRRRLGAPNRIATGAQQRGRVGRSPSHGTPADHETRRVGQGDFEPRSAPPAPIGAEPVDVDDLFVDAVGLAVVAHGQPRL
jgi:hypothetical protein